MDGLQHRLFPLATIEAVPVPRITPVNHQDPFANLDLALSEFLEGNRKTGLFGEEDESEGKYFLCFEDPEEPGSDWSAPQLCKSDGLESRLDLPRGLRWAPQYDRASSTDRLMAVWGRKSIDPSVGTIRKFITDDELNDETFMMKLTNDKEWEESLDFDFENVKVENQPSGFEGMSRLNYIYACKVPTPYPPREGEPESRIFLFLDNPHRRTTDKAGWANIPCRNVRFRLHGWLEQYRPRLSDEEDPELIPESGYETIVDDVPRVTRFLDEFGEIEPEWTEEELNDRRVAREEGKVYERSYIIERRREEEMDSSDVSVDSTNSLDFEIAESQAREGQNSNAESERNPQLNNILRDILMEPSERSEDESAPRDPGPRAQRGPRSNALLSAYSEALQRLMGADNLLWFFALNHRNGVFGADPRSREAMQQLGLQDPGLLGDGQNLINNNNDINRNNLQVGNMNDNDSDDWGTEGMRSTGANTGAAQEEEEDVNVADSNGSGASEIIMPNVRPKGKCSRYVGKFCKGLANAMLRVGHWIAPGYEDQVEPFRD